MRAQVTPPGEAIAAASAHDVPLAADQVAGMKVRDVRTDFDDFAGKLVANDQRNLDRGLRPVIPVIDMQVGPANAGGKDADLDIVNARFRLRHILQPQAGAFVSLNKGFHPAAPSDHGTGLLGKVAGFSIMGSRMVSLIFSFLALDPIGA